MERRIYFRQENLGVNVIFEIEPLETLHNAESLVSALAIPQN
jgi:hypothetical protein